MKKAKRGFTIVELVIVIGVIAILSAVLIPTFVNLSSKATEAKAKQEVADAYSAYIVDVSDGYYGEPSGGAKIDGEPKKQGEVYIVRSGESVKYAFTPADGWKVTTLGDGTLLGSANAYNNCSVYVKAA